MTIALVKTASTPFVQQSLARLEKDLGGRDRLCAALAHAPKDKALSYVLGLLGDPFHRTAPLADLCAMGGITAGELLDAYKAGQTNLSQALSLKGLDTDLPLVVADTFRMALPREQVCPICEGAGTLVAERTRRNPNPEPEPCKACHATGQQQIDGDLEHKKLALELGQLTSKGGGLSLNMQQNVAVLGASSGGALEQLQSATDQILYGTVHEPALSAAVSEEVVDSALVTPVTLVTEAELVDAEQESDWRGGTQE